MKKSGFVFFLFVYFLIPLGIFLEPSIAGAAQEIGPGPIKPEPRVLPTQITGTVRINGWTGDVAHAFIHAMPVGFGSSTDTRSAQEPRDVEHFTPLKRTADDHVFSFSVNGLLPNTPYRLGITLPPNPIRPRESIKTFWGGLPGGMATSGMPPVAIEGYVANTEVEIKDSNGNWAGAADVQYTEPETALRTLRWNSSIPGVVAGELQISLDPYPTTGNFGSCDEPEGRIVYRQQLAVGEGEWQEIGNLDFGKILSPRPTDNLPPPGIVPTDHIPTGDSTNVSPISEMDSKMLALGAPLYIRVVPVIDRGDGRRPACDLREDGVHGWVIVAKLPKRGSVSELPPLPAEKPHLEVLDQTYTPPTINNWGDKVRKGGGGVYKVIKAHKLPPCHLSDYFFGKCTGYDTGWVSYAWDNNKKDWVLVYEYDALGQALIDADSTWANPNQVVPEGFMFDYQVFHSGSCNFWCGAWNFASGFVTGLYSGLGDFVTWWAEAFQSIKSGVASVVADVVQVLPGVGELCKATENVASCKSIIEAGMDYGLASMGLPPSLPNWEQLQEQGMDYLASEVSQQMSSATGLPPDITKLAADKALELSKGMAQKTMEAMTENRGRAFNSWNANWVIPYEGMDPASRTIKLRKIYPGEAPYAPFPLPSNLYLKTEGNGSYTDLFVNDSYPYQFTGNLYLPENVHVPEFPPVPLVIEGKGASLNIPIVLHPDYSTIPAPECLNAMPLYDVQCSPVHIFSKASDGPSCWKSDGYSSFKQVDCTNYNAHIAIYYRDYWAENRLEHLESIECLHLSAAAYTYSWIADLSGLNPWHLFDPPFGTIALTPSQEENTWNGLFYLKNGCK